MILLFTALSVSMLFLPSRARSGPTAIAVEVSGKRALTIGLDEEGTREVDGPLGTTSIEVRQGQARILSSPCPLKICQRAGWIAAAGEMVVCLPNEVVVRMAGRRPGVDALSR